MRRALFLVLAAVLAPVLAPVLPPVLPLGVLSGCDIALGIDGLVADRTLCAGPCGTPDCGACPEGSMVDVASPVGTFRIDAFEVTNADYKAYLDTDPDLSAQRSSCTWNDSATPGVLSQAFLDASGGVEVDPECATWVADELATSGADRPVACVDWCDAVAYCAWSGKHLCGTIGGDGQIDATDPGPLTDASVSEWYRSCSVDGSRLYPYGDIYQPAVCNDENSRTELVGSYETCEGGVPGLYDMSGNVDEWEDACAYFNNPDPTQNCWRRGGPFWGDQSMLLCAAGRDTYRGTQGASTGFRCCSGP